MLHSSTRVLAGVKKSLFGHAAQENSLLKCNPSTTASIELIQVLIYQTLQRQRETSHRQMQQGHSYSLCQESEITPFLPFDLMKTKNRSTLPFTNVFFNTCKWQTQDSF